MKIFKFFKREKKKPEQLIKEFEIGRSMLMKRVREISDKLRKEGYKVLELIPIIVSVGKADPKSPFGIVMVVTNELYNKFNEYADMGTYGNNFLNMFHVGDYSFLLIVAKDDEKRLAICYPTAFRKKHVKKIQGKDIIYIYIVNGETSKYTLIYFPNVRWGVTPKSEIELKESEIKNEPPSTMYR